MIHEKHFLFNKFTHVQVIINFERTLKFHQQKKNTGLH